MYTHMCVAVLKDFNLQLAANESNFNIFASYAAISINTKLNHQDLAISVLYFISFHRL